jgi:chaperonin cofactor prefoldin
MGHRINERNTGHWSLDSEPKHVKTKPKKVSRSFTESEIEMFEYFMNRIVDNIKLIAEDLDNQVYRDNGNILIQFSRDRIEDVRSLLNKFNGKD